MRRPGPAAQERVQAGRVREQNGTAWRAQGQRGWAGQPLKKGQPHGDPGALGGGGLCAQAAGPGLRGVVPLSLWAQMFQCVRACASSRDQRWIPGAPPTSAWLAEPLVPSRAPAPCSPQGRPVASLCPAPKAQPLLPLPPPVPPLAADGPSLSPR